MRRCPRASFNAIRFARRDQTRANVYDISHVRLGNHRDIPIFFVSFGTLPYCAYLFLVLLLHAFPSICLSTYCIPFFGFFMWSGSVEQSAEILTRKRKLRLSTAMLQTMVLKWSAFIAASLRLLSRRIQYT